MNHIKIKNENGLELTVTDNTEECYPMLGGRDPMTWEVYLSGIEDRYLPHFNLIREAIEKLEWVGEKADQYANGTGFVFSDGFSISFSWRAWGDLMAAIVGKNEGYMAYYM